MEEVVIKIVDAVTPNILDGVNRLLPQLISNGKQVDQAELEAIINHQDVFLFVALINDRVVGVAQLTKYPRPEGAIAWVDCVIVDSAERGKGIATTLMDAVIAKAKTLGPLKLSLTSNAAREAANHIYTKLGFEPYDTNYYRYKF